MAAGAFGAVVLVAAGYMVLEATRGPEPAPAPVSETAPAGVAPTAGDPVPLVATSEGGTDATGAPDPAQTPEQTGAAPIAPSFDLVRVDADGATIIAGLAEPGSEVHVVLDGTDAAVVQADAVGNFVAMMDIGLSDKPRVLTLNSVIAGGLSLVSANTAIIEPSVPAIQSAEAEPVAPPVMVAENTETTPQVPQSDGGNVAPAETVETGETDAPQTPETSGDSDTQITSPDAGQDGEPGVIESAGASDKAQDTGAQSTLPVAEVAPVADGSISATQVEVQAEVEQTTTPEPEAQTEANADAATLAEGQNNTVAAMEGEPVEETLTDVATSPAQAVETDAVVSAGEEIAEIDEDAVNTVAGVEIAEVDYPPQTPIPGSDTAEVAETPEIAPTEAAQVETADAVAVPEVEFSDAPSVGEDVTVADSGEPAPPRVMIAGSEGITIVQQGGHGPVALESVTLDAITYDAIGEVQLSGRGAGAGNVRVYLDNNPIRTAAITESGQWRTGLPEVESGIYTLRVDELREDGTVTSRIETPFKREDADQLAAVAAEVAGDSGKAPVQAVTVQPGSTLWAIAKENYGEGTLYVRVFEANRDQIRDPDWIYPGQVFAIPGE